MVTKELNDVTPTLTMGIHAILVCQERTTHVEGFSWQVCSPNLAILWATLTSAPLRLMALIC